MESGCEFFWIGADGDAVFEPVVQKAFFFEVAKVFEQMVVKAAGVNYENGFRVYFQLIPRQHLEQLVQGAKTTGKE